MLPCDEQLQHGSVLSIYIYLYLSIYLSIDLSVRCDHCAESTEESDQDLHGEQPLAGVARVDGELQRQAGGHAGRGQARPAGPDPAGVVSREGLDLVGAVETEHIDLLITLVNL